MVELADARGAAVGPSGREGGRVEGVDGRAVLGVKATWTSVTGARPSSSQKKGLPSSPKPAARPIGSMISVMPSGASARS